MVFAGDAGGNLVAYNDATGKILWHSHIGNVSNAPETYTLDGKQYILVAAGDTLFTSGTLSRYSKILNSVMEAPGALYGDKEQ